MDRAHERARADAAIGTTMRGSARPTPTRRDARTAAELLADPVALAGALASHVATKNEALVGGYGWSRWMLRAILGEFTDARRLGPHLADGPALVDEALARGHMVLAEGAQGRCSTSIMARTHLSPVRRRRPAGP